MHIYIYIHIHIYMCVYIYICIGVCGYIPPVQHRATDPTPEIYTTRTTRKLTEWGPGYIGHPIRHPKVNGIVSPHPPHHVPPIPPVSCHKYTPHAYVCIHTCEYKTHKIKKNNTNNKKKHIVLYLCITISVLYRYVYIYVYIYIYMLTS